MTGDKKNKIDSYIDSNLLLLIFCKTISLIFSVVMYHTVKRQWLLIRVKATSVQCRQISSYFSA